jgi:hypothetical protein
LTLSLANAKLAHQLTERIKQMELIMQTLHEIEQIADRLTVQLFDSSIHNKSVNVDAAIKDLADEYKDDAEMIQDTILDTSFIDADQFWGTFKAMITASAFSMNTKLDDKFRKQQALSAEAFMKSLTLDVMTAIEKRAEWQVLK